MAQKPHEPTKEQRDTVMVLAAGGLPQELIAKVIKISVPTLEKVYREELDTGKSRITGKAIATLVRAMDAGGKGAVGAAAFWLKCREGWEERSAHRFVDAEGKDRDTSAAEILSSRIAGVAARIGTHKRPEGSDA